MDSFCAMRIYNVSGPRKAIRGGRDTLGSWDVAEPHSLVRLRGRWCQWVFKNWESKKKKRQQIVSASIAEKKRLRPTISFLNIGLNLFFSGDPVNSMSIVYNIVEL